MDPRPSTALFFFVLSSLLAFPASSSSPSTVDSPDFVYLVGYHGTSTTAAISVLETGFQRFHCDGVFGPGFYFSSKYEVAQRYARGGGAILRAIIRVQRNRLQVVRKHSPGEIMAAALGGNNALKGFNEAWQRLEEKDVLLEVPESKDSHYEIVLKPEFGGSVGVDSVVKTPATMIVHLENVTAWSGFLSCIFCRRRAVWVSLLYLLPAASEGGCRMESDFSGERPS